MPLSVRRPAVSPAAYRRITLAALCLLVFIVVTGAAVRLTGSGLGCTDWPSCTDESLVAPLELHPMVEFVNRLITGLVSAIVIVAVLASRWRVPRRRDLEVLSWGLVAGVLAQIVLGGIVVLSHLNPWLVQGHFIVSMLLVLDATVLDHRAGQPEGPRRPCVEPGVLRLGKACVALAALAIVSGTVVTGAGPHSGENEGDFIERLPIAVHDAARIHGAFLIAFLAVTIVLLVRLRRDGVDGRVLHAAEALLTVLALQGAIGYTQYFTGVPPLLVGLHVLGATLVWVASLRLLLVMSAPVEPTPGGPRESRDARRDTGDQTGRDLVANG